MDGLDFSALTDDQLVELARACCLEAVRRSPATRMAMEAMMLDEAERVRIARTAGEQEAAAIRAAERERVAREAAAAVRAAEEQRTGAARREAAQREGEAAVRIAAERAAASMSWLRRAGAIVGRHPQAIQLSLLDTPYGRRVLVDPGAEKFERDHLADYTVATKTLKTKRDLLPKRAELIALAAEFAALHPTQRVRLVGADYQWETV